MVTYIQGVALSSSFPLFAPFVIPFPLPLYFPLLTWRPPAVTNCPPSYQVSCRLTPFAPPFTQSTDPFQAPPEPQCSAPDNDDIGATPLPLCGTFIMWDFWGLNIGFVARRRAAE